MDADRLLQLAAFLDTLPDKLFNFASWVIEGTLAPPLALERGGGCGTTACAVGWCPAVFPKEWKWERDAYEGVVRVVLNDSRGAYEGPLGGAERFFQLTYSEAVFLFTPHDCNDEECDEQHDAPRPDRKATAKQVAQHIRDFVANGGQW